MSITSWKKEFYPKDARKVRGIKAAIDHSVLKWTGLLKKNLAKHKLSTLFFGDIRDDDCYTFSVDSDSCALCSKYYNPAQECSNCPYTIVKGQPCYKDYWEWVDNNNARPMLKSLKVVQKAYSKESKK